MKKNEYDELKILNDQLNKEIKESNKELDRYSNELDKLYNSTPQKMIKTIEEINEEKKGLEQKINCVRKRKKRTRTKK